MQDGDTDGDLERVLSKWAIFAIGFGAIVGWGWIIQVGYWIDQAGPLGAMVAFVIGGVLITLICLVYAELVSAMPIAGGEQVYSMRAFGPAGSFVCSWSLLLGYLGVIGFQSIAIGAAVSYLVPGFDILKLWAIAGEPIYGTWVAVGLLGILGVTYMNYRGVKITAQIQMILTVVIALAGIVLVIGGFTTSHPVSNAPFGGVGFAGIAAVAIQVPMLFSGFAVIPQAAEEADMPPRSLALVVLAVVGCVAAFYIVSIWAAGQALPAEVLGNSLVPAASAMSALYNSELLGQLMAVVGIAALITSWSAFTIGASRLLLAMADSGLLPEALAEVHPEYNTPTKAIILTGAISVVAPWLGAQSITTIINAGSLGLVFAWFGIVASFLVLRYREPNMDRPFKLPAGYVIGFLALLLSVAYMGFYMPGGPSALGWQEWIIILAWAILGAVLWILSSNSSHSPDPELAGTSPEGSED